jgi:peptidyl-dipeptidase Dcp
VEVTDKNDETSHWLVVFHPYARAGKRSGAWMNAISQPERLDGEVTTSFPITQTLLKVTGRASAYFPGVDAQTLFHEFGHALHGLNSSVTFHRYLAQAVPRDYVEFSFRNCLSTGSQRLKCWNGLPFITRLASQFRRR